MHIISPYDILEVIQEVLGRGPGWLFRRLKVSRTGRVSAAWGEKKEMRVWPEQLTRHTFKKISGSPDISPPFYFANRYLSNRDSVAAMSIGCGEGTHELEWAGTGMITRLDGFDLSEHRIHLAKKRAVEASLESILNFEVKNILDIDDVKNNYDLVIAIASLHHFTPLEQIIQKIADLLEPGGLLYVNEYVGPRKWQWTENQLAAANRILERIPKKYRRKTNGFFLRRAWKPGLLRMFLSDPSEAVESDMIIPLLDTYFERVEFIPLGGSLTQLVFGKIAHNFQSADEEAREIIEMVLAEEERLISEKQISSDFLCAVYRKPDAESIV
jgi:2-polyprenyl-3-methyl-5-hydroxy-6-metoxy-1,4-benzoquinol methylase